MSPREFVYNNAFKKFVALGYSERDSEQVGCDAVRLWARQSKGINAIDEAVKNGKKLYKVRK